MVLSAFAASNDHGILVSTTILSEWTTQLTVQSKVRFRAERRNIPMQPEPDCDFELSMPV